MRSFPPSSDGAERAARPAIAIVSGESARATELERALRRDGMSVRRVAWADALESVAAWAPDAIVVLRDEPAEPVLDALVVHAEIADVALVWIGPPPSVTPPSLACLDATLPELDTTEAIARLATRGAARESASGTATERLALALSGRFTGRLVLRGAHGVERSVATGPGDALAQAREVGESLAAVDEPISVRWEARPASRQSRYEAKVDLRAGRPSIEGVRVMLLGTRERMTPRLVQGLEIAGARVMVVDPGGAGLGRARAWAPDVVVATADDLEDESSATSRALAGDARLAWAARLVVPLGLEPALTLDALAAGIGAAMAPARSLAARAQKGSTFARLATLGPVRLLRALVALEGGHRVVGTERGTTVEIDLADGVVAGARAMAATGARAEGHVALATWLASSGGRVSIEPRPRAQWLDVMRPLEEALPVALEQRPLGVSGVQRAVPDGGPSVQDASATRAALGRVVDERLSQIVRAHARAEDDRPTLPPVAPAPRAPERDRRVLSDPPPPAAAPSPKPDPITAPSMPAVKGTSRRATARGALAGGVALIALAIGGGALWMQRGERTPAERDAALDVAIDAADEEAERDVSTEQVAADARARPDRPPAAVDAPAPVTPLDAESIESMILHAHLAWRRGDLATASRYYADILRADPSNGRALVGAVRVARSAGDRAEATRAARRLLEAHPDHPANYVLLGDLLRETGDDEGALEIYRTATRRFPRHGVARERYLALRRR